MSAPVYLFTGPEFGERNAQVDSVKKALKKKYGSSDDFLFYASDVKISDIVTQLRTDSLFIPATCIVLRQAELIKKKEDIEMIGDWVASVTPDKKNETAKDSSVLILVSDENSVDSKLEKLVPKENKKLFFEMFEDKKEEWLQSFFRKNSLSITGEAVDLILDMVENNTEAMRSECSRFFVCFPKGHSVTAQDVEQILAHNREESAFTLFDSMTDSSVEPNRRFENSLLILQKILLSKGSNSVMLLAGLTSCFRRLSTWHTVHFENPYPDDFVLRTNGFAGKLVRAQYSKAARIWNFAQVTSILALLSETDMLIRSTGNNLQTTYLYLLLYEIIIKKGVSCSKYETDF